MPELPKPLTIRRALGYLLGKFRDARPEAVLLTTFNFSSGFFESNVLPVIAGAEPVDTKGAAAARPEINAALKNTKVVVVCDRSARPEPKGNFRYGLLPIGLRNGRFHPKIILVAGSTPSGKSELWLAVGSGNLSMSGWALNREVVGVTQVHAAHRPE